MFRFSRHPQAVAVGAIGTIGGGAEGLVFRVALSDVVRDATESRVLRHALARRLVDLDEWLNTPIVERIAALEA